MSGRDGKNLDSTENVKMRQKLLLKSEKLETFLFRFTYEGGLNISMSYLRGVKNFLLVLRGGFKIFITSFQIRLTPYCWVINEQPLISENV